VLGRVCSPASTGALQAFLLHARSWVAVLSLLVFGCFGITPTQFEELQEADPTETLSSGEGKPFFPARPLDEKRDDQEEEDGEEDEDDRDEDEREKLVAVALINWSFSDRCARCRRPQTAGLSADRRRPRAHAPRGPPST
jgi:hypothetical protein